MLSTEKRTQKIQADVSPRREKWGQSEHDIYLEEYEKKKEEREEREEINKEREREKMQDRNKINEENNWPVRMSICPIRYTVHYGLQCIREDRCGPNSREELFSDENFENF